jgi:hypothetical protein
MSKDTIEEYKSLRDEIGRNSEITANVFLANISLSAAIIAYGLSSKTGAIFLTPFAVIIPSLFFFASQLESTTRIASYIQVFVEPELDLRWEKRWLEIRKQKLLPHYRKYTLSLTGLYGSLGLACLILAYVYWNATIRTYLFTVIPIMVLLVLSIITLHKAFSTDFCKKYSEKWQELKDIEQSGIAP